MSSVNESWFWINTRLLSSYSKSVLGYIRAGIYGTYTIEILALIQYPARSEIPVLALITGWNKALAFLPYGDLWYAYLSTLSVRIAN
jgi:hypothetical protein